MDLRLSSVMLSAVFVVACAAPAEAASSLRFFGAGVNDVDRVKIRVDPPDLVTPGPPADVGATDFTIEFWLRGLAADNLAPAVACGDNLAWIFGNIVLDRDRYNQGRKFGLSIAGGVVVWGVTGPDGASRTICGTNTVLDGAWHHIAVQRRRTDGQMWLFVDGALEAQATGPTGDVSYPDDGVPGNFCGGPCVNSDPFLVLAAEKHDAGPEYPSFSGWLDELRLSTALRYNGSFARPLAPFATDAATAALYHFDEGVGLALGDASGALGGPSDGVLRVGGTPTGPQWSADVFESMTADASPVMSSKPMWAKPNPFRTSTAIVVPATLPGARLVVTDAQGRCVTRLAGAFAGGATRFEWNGENSRGERVPPGIYLARVTGTRGAPLRIALR